MIPGVHAAVTIVIKVEYSRIYNSRLCLTTYHTSVEHDAFRIMQIKTQMIESCVTELHFLQNSRHTNFPIAVEKIPFNVRK